MNKLINHLRALLSRQKRLAARPLPVTGSRVALAIPSTPACRQIAAGYRAALRRFAVLERAVEAESAQTWIGWFPCPRIQAHLANVLPELHRSLEVCDRRVAWTWMGTTAFEEPGYGLALADN